MINEKQFKEILRRGGATLDKNGNNTTISQGYCVSVFGAEYKTTDEQKALDKVNEYLKEDNGFFVGVWLDSGFIYIDKSIILEDKSEALETGKKWKQIAIYDLKASKSLYINDYDFIKSYSLYRRAKNNDFKIVKQYDNINDIIKDLKISKNDLKNYITTSLEKIRSFYDNKYFIVSDYFLTSDIL